MVVKDWIISKADNDIKTGLKYFIYGTVLFSKGLTSQRGNCLTICLQCNQV